MNDTNKKVHVCRSRPSEVINEIVNNENMIKVVEEFLYLKH